MPSDFDKGFYNIPSGGNSDIAAAQEGARARGMMEAQARAEAGKPEKETPHSFFPKSESKVQGPAFALVVMAPFLVIAYPAGGALTLAAMTGVKLATEPFMHQQQFAQLLVMLGACLVVFYFALKIEAFCSRSKIYRFLRQITRLALLGGFALTLTATKGRGLGYARPEEVFNNGSGGAIFGALMITLFLAWLFYFLDRLFFPVADYVKADERRAAREAAAPRYAVPGVGKFAMVALPIATVLGVGYFVPHVSVALLVALAFGSGWLCWRIFRRKIPKASS